MKNTIPKFINYDNKKVQNRIESDLKIITKIILKYHSDVDSLILAGGFGRGEGSVLISGKDIQPINDYDIYVIVKNSSNKINLEKLRKLILEKVSIRQVDLELIKKKKLPHLKPTMSNYDLKYASHIFYGNVNILKTIPSINPKKLSLREGRTPLLLYLIALLQSYPGEKNALISSNDKFWIYQQISKSILGWSAALLILEGKYHSSYVERERIFRENFENKLWCSLVEKATRFKLSPSLEIEEDLYSLWHINKEVHIKILMFFLSKYYKKDFNNWTSIIKHYRNDYENMIKKLFGFFSRNKSYKDRINLTVIEILVLVAKEKSDVDKKLLNTIKNEIKQYNNSENFSWDDARKFCIENDPNCAIWRKRGNSIFYNL